MHVYSCNGGNWSEAGNWEVVPSGATLPPTEATLESGDIIVMPGNSVNIDVDVVIPQGVLLQHNVPAVSFKEVILKENKTLTIAGQLEFTDGGMANGMLLLETGASVLLLPTSELLCSITEMSGFSINFLPDASILIQGSFAMERLDVSIGSLVVIDSMANVDIGESASITVLDSGVLVAESEITFSDPYYATLTIAGGQIYFSRTGKTITGVYGDDLLPLSNTYGLPTNDMIGV